MFLIRNLQSWASLLSSAMPNSSTANKKIAVGVSCSMSLSEHSEHACFAATVHVH